MGQTIQLREPIEFAAGDTVSFTRSLPDYPALQGWSLKYELRGQTQAIEFLSTGSGNDHVLLVLAATTAAWLPGDYVLSGYAVNGAERHTIYYGAVTVFANLPASGGAEPRLTFAQQMIVNLEAVILAKSQGDIAMSTLGENQFKYFTFEALRHEHGYWKMVRAQEVAKERAKAGLPTGNKIRPLFRVLSPGPAVGMFGRGSGYGGF